MTECSADDLRGIHNLLADYGSTLDEQRWADHLALWTAEGELFVFGRSHRGHEAIDRFMRRAVHGKHLTAVPHVEIDGERALSIADYVFYRSTDLAFYSAGVYRDDLVRTREGWRIARREIVIQHRRKD